MGQALLIVWRESVEALLVIGLLHAWLSRQYDARQLLRKLWEGVAAGIALATLLALLMVVAGSWMSGTPGEWFQAAMSALASLLILQVVVWMSQNSGNLRNALESRAQQALAHNRHSGLTLLATLAIAREGSEIAIFLYGAVGSASAEQTIAGALLGGALGALSFVLLQRGSRFLDWRRFFTISETLLLLLGGSMLMNALDRATGQLMGMDLPEALYGWLGDPLWDTSAWLDDGARISGLIAGMTGYRAMPSAVAVAVLVSYWLLAWWLRRPRANSPSIRAAT